MNLHNALASEKTLKIQNKCKHERLPLLPNLGVPLQKVTAMTTHTRCRVSGSLLGSSDTHTIANNVHPLCNCHKQQVLVTTTTSEHNHVHPQPVRHKPTLPPLQTNTQTMNSASETDDGPRVYCYTDKNNGLTVTTVRTTSTPQELALDDLYTTIARGWIGIDLYEPISALLWGFWDDLHVQSFFMTVREIITSNDYNRWQREGLPKLKRLSTTFKWH